MAHNTFFGFLDGLCDEIAGQNEIMLKFLLQEHHGSKSKHKAILISNTSLKLQYKLSG